MDKSHDRCIAQVAAQQHGVFRLDQVDAAGFTRDERAHRVRTGRWEARYDRVYAMGGVPCSWRGDLLAACWGAQGLAVVSHRAAARLRDLPGGRELVEITCHRWKRAKGYGVTVHETLSLTEDDMDVVDGIPTASVDQTLLGLAATVDARVVEMAVDRALNRKMTTIPALEQFVRRKGGRGRNGIGVLRGIVRDLDPLAGVPESAMETKLKQVLRRAGLPTPEFQYEIWHDGRFVARVDAAYPEHRIALEYDSYEHHTGRDAIVRDNDRRNALKRIRWRTVVFTAADVVRDGGGAIEALRAELDLLAP
jgi:very-short-patch-repair endonuclease